MGEDEGREKHRRLSMLLFWTLQNLAIPYRVARSSNPDEGRRGCSRHRGCFSGFWSIHEGDSETGVTCHRMVEKFDEGRIIYQARQPIALMVVNCS